MPPEVAIRFAANLGQRLGRALDPLPRDQLLSLPPSTVQIENAILQQIARPDIKLGKSALVAAHGLVWPAMILEPQWLEQGGLGKSEQVLPGRMFDQAAREIRAG